MLILLQGIPTYIYVLCDVFSLRYYRDRPRRSYDDGPRYGHRGSHDYDGGRGGPRRRSPDYDRRDSRRREEPAERPRLQLQPRSKPLEKLGPGDTGMYAFTACNNRRRFVVSVLCFLCLFF